MKEKRASRKFLWVSLFFVCLSLLAILPATLSADNPPRGWLTKNFTLMTWNVQDIISIPPSPGNPNDKRNFIKSVKEELKNNEYPLSVVGIQEDFSSHIFDLVYNNYDFMYFVHPTLPDNLPDWYKAGDGLAVFTDFEVINDTHIPWEDVANLIDRQAKKGFLWSIIRIPVEGNNSFVIHFYNLHTNSQHSTECVYARKFQLYQLNSFMNLHSSGMPVVVCGDFNIDGLDEGGEYKNIKEILIDNQNLKMANWGLEETHPGSNTKYDYIFYRPGDADRYKLWITKEAMSKGYLIRNEASECSDHLSVEAFLSYSVNYDAFPDLTITDIQYQSNSAGILNAYVTVKNLGPSATPDGTIRVDFRIREYKKGIYFKLIPALTCGESATIVFELVGDIPEGPFMGKASVDFLMEIEENNEFNNGLIKTFGSGLPDVVIDRVWLDPAEPQPGQQVTINATIRNQGDGATPNGIVVAAAFRVDGEALGAFFVRTNNVDRPLAAGESYSAACEIPWTAIAGAHNFWSMADDVNRFEESDEDNNVREISIGNPTPVGITLISPNGGEQWNSGAPAHISWSSSGLAANTPIKFDLFKGPINQNAEFMGIMAEGIEVGSGVQSYTWNGQMVIPWTLPAGSDYWICIQPMYNSNPSMEDCSDAQFSILSSGATYTITATAGAGGTITPASHIVSAGGSCSFLIQPSPGYQIKKVLVDNSLDVTALVKANGNSYPFENVQANQSIRVEYELITANFRVTSMVLDNSGGAITQTSGPDVPAGSNVSFHYLADQDYILRQILVYTAPPPAGQIAQYVINDYTGWWVLNNVQQNLWVVFDFDSPWQPYTITATAGAGGTINPSGNVIVAQGASQTFAVTANPGYAVQSVTVDGNNKGAITSYTFSDVRLNHAITSVFAPAQSYTITATAGAGGTITPSSQTVTPGGSCTFYCQPSSGYQIKKVLVNNSLDVTALVKANGNSYPFENVQANQSIRVEYELIAANFRVTSMVLNWTGGAITQTSGPIVARGSNVSFHYLADPNYILRHIGIHASPPPSPLIAQYTIEEFMGWWTLYNVQQDLWVVFAFDHL